MGGVVSAASDITTDEADPEIGVGVTDGTFVETYVVCLTCAVVCSLAQANIILRVSAYGTARPSPLLKTRAVEDVLAKNCKEACRFVHTLQAYRTCR